MKKLLFILLPVILLCPIFSVGVSAAQTDTYILQGVFQLNDKLSIPENTSFLSSFEGSFYSSDNTHLIGFEVDSNILYFKNAVGSPSRYPAYDITENQYYSKLFKTLRFNGVEVSETFLAWLQVNSTELYCDGSTCSVGDSNDDGYCEDCYRLMRTVAPDQTVDYPSNIPPLPDYAKPGGTWNHEVIIVKDGNDIFMYHYRTDQGYYVWGNSQTADVILEAYDTFNTGTKYVVINGEWDYVGNLGGDYTIGTHSDILWSSVPIYDENGDYFFPVALWAQILKTTQGAMKVTIPKMDSSLDFLIVCGVGCLALLIGLILLVKVFRKYRKN